MPEGSEVYRHAHLSGAEPVEEYEAGGYHPVNYGDILHATNNPDSPVSNNSYRVLKKLDCTARSTVWLAKDGI